MDLKFKKYHPFWILIPALTAFLIVLIPTVSYHWPLSWDIIYHVEYAKIYSQYGFSLQKNYPPLFHFLILTLGNTFKMDYFQLARFLQPFLAMLIVFSVSYITKKFYGLLAGVSAGFLVISSYLIFRIMLPIPENMALLFLIFSIYFYYKSIREKNLKYAGITGILLLTAAATHRNVPLIMILVISLLTFIESAIYRNKSILKNYAVFLAPLIILIVAMGILLMWKPDFLIKIVQQVIATYFIHVSASYTDTLSLSKYLKFIGPLLLISSFIGGVVSIRKRQEIGIFLAAWAIIMFLISESYWLGFNVESTRFLVYMLIPLSILGGYGLDRFYYRLKEYPLLSSSKFRSAFLVFIFAISAFSGIITVTEPNINFFWAKTAYENIQIAPPSASEVDLANWFEKNGDKNKNVTISNRYSGIFLSAAAGMKIAPNFGNFTKNTTKSTYNKNNVGYIVYDKRLTFPSKNGTFYMQNTGSGLFFYSGDIHKNLYRIKPGFAKTVYENKDFIVCKV